MCSFQILVFAQPTNGRSQRQLYQVRRARAEAAEAAAEAEEAEAVQCEKGGRLCKLAK